MWWRKVFQPMQVPTDVLKIRGRGAVVSKRTWITMTWRERVAWWAKVRAMRVTWQAYLTKALWLD